MMVADGYFTIVGINLVPGPKFSTRLISKVNGRSSSATSIGIAQESSLAMFKTRTSGKSV